LYDINPIFLFLVHLHSYNCAISSWVKQLLRD